jgi:hypothetical protein
MIKIIFRRSCGPGGRRMPQAYHTDSAPQAQALLAAPADELDKT